MPKTFTLLNTIKLINLCLLFLATQACQQLKSKDAESIAVDVNQQAKVNTSNVDQKQHDPLANSFDSLFQIGVAINQKQATGEDKASRNIIDKHFQVLTAENDMKWESIQKVEGNFTFDGADALLNYAKQSSKDVIGHVLVWHSQTPDWVFTDEQGEPASRELLLDRMKTQIFALAGRYKGKIKGWDVVNEAFEDDGSFRQSKWYQILGEEFIEKAFEFAQQADPNAQLYYNDYNLFKPAKIDAAIALANRLRDKGIRIDGIGLQGHYGMPPPVAELESSIQKVADNNLMVMITELDITVLKFPDEEKMGADVSLNFALKDEYNPYPNGISSEASQQLAKAYTDLFRLFIKYQKHIDRVTLWGVSDNNTWRNNWPMKGRTDYPLLFDRNYQAKPFVNELISLAEQQKR